MKKQTIVLFGGSFDPIHVGHTTVASYAIDQLQADLVFFIPAKRSPLKTHTPTANDQQRLHMIELAIQEYTGYQVSDFELNRPAPSYTLNTVKYFKETYPNSTLYWLMGADTIKDLPHWYGIEELIDSCILITMYRAGCPKPDFSSLASVLGEQRVARLSNHILPTPLIPISSTEIRQRLKKNKATSEYLHPKVAQYIKENGLYG